MQWFILSFFFTHIHERPRDMGSTRLTSCKKQTQCIKDMVRKWSVEIATVVASPFLSQSLHHDAYSRTNNEMRMVALLLFFSLICCHKKRGVHTNPSCLVFFCALVVVVVFVLLFLVWVLFSAASCFLSHKTMRFLCSPLCRFSPCRRTLLNIVCRPYMALVPSSCFA